MKEGIQIKDSAIKTTRKRRRGGTNFTGSKQKRRNDLKKREGTCVGISETTQARKGTGKSSLRLGCHLEPIIEDKQVTSETIIERSRPGTTVEGEREMGDCDSQLGFESDSETQDAGGETVRLTF